MPFSVIVLLKVLCSSPKKILIVKRISGYVVHLVEEVCNVLGRLIRKVHLQCQQNFYCSEAPKLCWHNLPMPRPISSTYNAMHAMTVSLSDGVEEELSKQLATLNLDSGMFFHDVDLTKQSESH